MAVYIVSYDIKTDNDDAYEEVYEILNKYNHCRMQDSVWLLDSSKSAAEIFDELDELLEEGDKLFVCRLRKSWKNRGKCSTWLKNKSRSW